MKKMRLLLFLLIGMPLMCLAQDGQQVKELRRLNKTAVEVVYNDGKTMTIDFYGPKIFRLFRDDAGGIIRNPEATPPAEILVKDARREVDVYVENRNDDIIVTTQPKNQSAIVDPWVKINKKTGLFTIWLGHDIVSQTAPVEFKDGGYNLHLSMQPEEYFFGGGVQNGRFSHRGQKIDIVNTNSWTDGGVCSPAPFFWSNSGYGVLCHTFKPGFYDFTGKETLVHHDDDYLDVFFMIDNGPIALLNDYYQLTGHPLLLPKFAFYEGHLNAYNRDYWKETNDTERGILFEDGKHYVESQKAVEGGIRESLNGDVGAYQFSARAVVDRYNAADMPLGWVLPNDGYGAGYGQTETLDGNIANLKAFGDYAWKNGVEIGLWTQSNLHPVEGVSALLQRDIVKEVRDAGVRVLKTDVAWVGSGYSFGLNGIADVAQIMPYYGQQARPFIISLDGWAGTQRYAGIWTGDQTGGEWEYIRFHIPTYIGAGLSGMPNITSDMDGIFGGRNMDVNIRDFQWKTFTPMQLNMDGWGSNPKYPQALGEPATSINRSYLKWKSMLLPYTYTFAHEAISGKPLIRAMFLEEDCSDNSELYHFLYGKRTQYQYMYGPWLLVAPVYEAGETRNGIYLPGGNTWYDYFTGEAYNGGRIINSFPCPLWKIPVFVKEGAIIPMNNANNNPSQIDSQLRIFEVYPSSERTSINVFDDDGVTNVSDESTTCVEQYVEKGKAFVTVWPTVLSSGQQRTSETKTTRFVVNMAKEPKSVMVKVNGKKYASTTTYNPSPNLNRFSTPGSEMAKLNVKKNPQLVVEVPTTDVNKDKIELVINGFVPIEGNDWETRQEKGEWETNVIAADGTASAYTLTPTWLPVDSADYYEVKFEGMCYSTIRDTHLFIDQLQPETKYEFLVRAVNADKQTPWTTISMSTSADPFEFALRGLSATCSTDEQPGFGLERLFDFAEGGDIWHTDYQKQAVPFTLTIDLNAFATLDRLQYVPRQNAGNGTILEGDYSLSIDGKTWTTPEQFSWTRDNRTKEINLANHQTSQYRFVRLNVSKAVGNFGSGAEFYAFYKPGTKYMIPGDINEDGKIDENDMTSYMNYTGLRQGDGDFEGYISKGDINRNGIIDAYDISHVATKLDGGIYGGNRGILAGNITATPDKTTYNAGDDIIITVSGQKMQAINALSLSLPYKETDMSFVSVEPVAVKEMRNLTNDRLHSNGDKVLYPTFVNIGNQHVLADDAILFRLHFKAQRKLSMKQVPMKGMLVDKSLNTIEF